MVTVSDKLCEAVSKIDARVTVMINRESVAWLTKEGCELVPLYSDAKRNEDVMNFVASLIENYFVKPINDIMEMRDVIIHLNRFVESGNISYHVFTKRISTDEWQKGIVGIYGNLDVAGTYIQYTADDGMNWVEVLIELVDKSVIFDFRFVVFDDFKKRSPQLASRFRDDVTKFLSVINSLLNNEEELSKIVLIVLFP